MSRIEELLSAMRCILAYHGPPCVALLAVLTLLTSCTLASGLELHFRHCSQSLVPSKEYGVSRKATMRHLCRRGLMRVAIGWVLTRAASRFRGCRVQLWSFQKLWL